MFVILFGKDGWLCFDSQSEAWKIWSYVLYVGDRNGTLYTIRISVYYASKMNITEHYAFFGSWARQLSNAPISMICTPNDQHLTIQLYGATPSAHVHVLLKSFYESLFDAWQSHPRFEQSFLCTS